MLRGTWGATLHDMDMNAFENMFEGKSVDVSVVHPSYILRPGPADVADPPALEWLLFGTGVKYEHSGSLAWRASAKRGLGSKRLPFEITAFIDLKPSICSRHFGYSRPVLKQPWTLDMAGWPLDGDPATTPCRLEFLSPLRLLRKRQLITEPSLPDISVAILRRVLQFSPYATAPAAKALQAAALDLAKRKPKADWRGERLDLTRWSANQNARVEMYGVIGSLDLLHGPGSLWPVLAAGLWCHLGKGTVFGLGQYRITPI